MTKRLLTWFWYLLPANPILVRVVYGQSRRRRHLWLRFGYLAILLAVVMFSLISGGSSGSLSELAKGASKTFASAAVVQLALMCFLAPVFTAGAITQEKDAQTYNILISTPLSNAQIVIGSLMSRLYFVIVLLVAALPIFFTTMIYGGVTSGQIFRCFAIAGATAIITGSLAITVSMIRVGTRRTIFSFFLAIGLYLFSVYALTYLNYTTVPEAPPNPASQKRLSWLAAFHPFLAMDVALDKVRAPELAAVVHYGPIGKYFVAYPDTVYIVMTLLISMLLAVVSMFFARRVVREGEVSWLSRMTSRFRRKPRGERSRKPHNVWANPVAWREAVTRASATSRGIGRYVVVGCGALAAIVLLYYYLSGKGSFKVADARQWLAALVAVEFGLVLIIATNTAASALTKEKESKSMDILLTTPLTSSYIIWGKLRGLVSSVVPLIAVPTASLLLFAICDIVRRQHPRVVALEVGVELGLLMVVFSAYACLLGLHFSLKQRRTVRAVMISVGILVVVNLGATLFWQEIIDPTKSIGAGLAPGTPFTSVFVLINPDRLFATPGDIDRHLSAVRTAAVFGCAIFLAIHGTIVYSWYRSMVRGFDMIIRKQSGQF